MRWDKMKVKSNLLVTTLLVVGAFAVACLIGILGVFLGGQGQIFTPGFLGRKLHAGMNIADVDMALGGVCRQSLSTSRLESGITRQYCKVSSSGIVSYFVPQHDTIMEFDERGILQDMIVNWKHRLDEETEKISF